MNKEFKDFIKSGSISSGCMGLFYPLEIAKVRLQSNKSLRVPLRTYYRGLSKSLLFVFPEKGIKFTTFNYCQNNKYNFSSSILATTITQSIISTPIENYRINNQIRKYKLLNNKIYRGYQFSVMRDIIFNTIFFKKSYKKTQLIDNMIGGLLATSLATPIDVIKTKYQQGNSLRDIFKKINIKPLILLKGIIPRTLSIGGFYGLTYFIYQNF